MTLVDRFICRREGHVPMLRVTSANPPLTYYISPCARCGKLIEVRPDEDGERP